jgi:phosphoesterase RecJ-like protein
VFRYLPGFEEIRPTPPPAFDCSILLDCADQERINLRQGALANPPDILIDHHITNAMFAGINLVDPAAVATAAIITDQAEALGLAIPREAAACLLAGLVTDTLGFRTPNTNAHTLEIAQRLMRTGASLPEAIERGMNRRSFTAARFWGYGLSTLERDGEIVWATLTLEARKASEYPGRGDDADLINVLASIEGTRVALLFVEQEGGKIKISWRVREGLDVTRLAISFGGGGHPAASGALVAGGLEEVRSRVLTATRAWLDTSKTGRGTLSA